MAAPHVAGLAALIIAQNPALNNLQVKALIEDRAADTDHDGYSNIEEYEARTHPQSSAEAPFVIHDTIPEHNAGISDDQRVPYNTTVAVFIESANAIDMTDEAWAPENLPDSNTVAADDPDLGGVLDDGIEVISGELTGAKILFNSSELLTPLFGPMNEVPPVSDADGVGIPMNLQPPAVFDNPVKILIPCPGYDNVSGLDVHYYDGNSWILAVDAAGNVQPGGEGLVLPGSRINHNDTDPPTIEIRIFHFSGFQAAVAASFSSVSGGGGGGGGGGCFISSASSKPVLHRLIAYALFTFALTRIGIYAFNKIMCRR
jgi:hypothetical protein